MKRLQVAYILIITVIGILFIFRESVNIYWMQTYHADSPLMAIERMILGQDEAEDTEEINIAGINTTETPKTSEKIETEEMKAERLLKEAEAARKAAELAEIEAQNADPYRFLKPDETRPIAGPNVPQLPEDVVLEAGDKLFFVGDSLMQGVAPRVRQTLYKSDNIDGVDLSKQSTGLAYPNFFNWPKVVAETLQKDAGIKGVIVYLGANDPWDFPVPGRKSYLRFKTAEWERAYRERIRSILLSAHQYNLPVIWLGAPCMRKDKLHKDMVYLNTIYQSEVEKFNGTYIPTSDILGCSDDAYNAYVQSEKGSQKVRTNDGIHFTPTGQRLISERVIEAFTIIRPEPESTEDLAQDSADKERDHKDGAVEKEASIAAKERVKEKDAAVAIKPKPEAIPQEVPEVPKRVSTPKSSDDKGAREHLQKDMPQISREKEKADAVKVEAPKVPAQTQAETAAKDVTIPVPVTPKSPSTPVQKNQLQWADGTEIAPSDAKTEEPTQIYPEVLDIWYTE